MQFGDVLLLWFVCLFFWRALNPPSIKEKIKKIIVTGTWSKNGWGPLPYKDTQTLPELEKEVTSPGQPSTSETIWVSEQLEITAHKPKWHIHSSHVVIKHSLHTSSFSQSCENTCPGNKCYFWYFRWIQPLPQQKSVLSV